jgi:2-methylcitrate dehydratase PrpD
MKKLVEQHDIQPDEVAEVQVYTGENVIAPGPLRILHANSGLEAKFCVPFQMASIILRRRAGLTEFTNEFVQSAACQQMQRKISAKIDPEIVALGKGQIVCRIVLTKKDGQTYTQVSEPVYRGGPKNPLTWEEVSEKFRDCSQKVLRAEDADAFLDLAKDFETLPDLKQLIDKVLA